MHVLPFRWLYQLQQNNKAISIMKPRWKFRSPLRHLNCARQANDVSASDQTGSSVRLRRAAQRALELYSSRSKWFTGRKMRIGRQGCVDRVVFRMQKNLHFVCSLVNLIGKRKHGMKRRILYFDNPMRGGRWSSHNSWRNSLTTARPFPANCWLFSSFLPGFRGMLWLFDYSATFLLLAKIRAFL